MILALILTDIDGEHSLWSRSRCWSQSSVSQRGTAMPLSSLAHRPRRARRTSRSVALALAVLMPAAAVSLPPGPAAAAATRITVAADALDGVCAAIQAYDGA